MPTYYVDSAGSNTAPYDTWAKAAQSPNTIEAVPVAAGDTVYCRGTFSGLWTWAVSGTSTLDAGTIKWIGCDAAGTPFAGQYVIDSTGQNNSINGARNYRQIYNVTSQNATFVGFVASGDYNLYKNCIFENHGQHGAYANSGDLGCWWLNCIFRNNTLTGIYRPQNSTMTACYAYGNGTYGMEVNAGVELVHCGAYDNDTDNFYVAGGNSSFMNGFSHASSAGSGIRLSSVAIYTKIFGMALTSNNQYGIEIPAGNPTNHEDYNGFLLNGVAERLNCPTGESSITFSASPYVDAGAGNFSTSDTADGRRTEIDMEFA